ncbi:hypothetical protein C0995_014927 [Termitomyces sp. Mi166|nr:hypothetical protein C0995_014927 [Termitomyces sp. Mi166\
MSDSEDMASVRHVRGWSVGALSSSTAPAVASSLSAPADDSDSAQADSTLTEIPEDTLCELPEGALMDLEHSVTNSSDNEDNPGRTVFSTPCVNNGNLQEEGSVNQEGPRRRARVEITHQNGQAGLTQEQSETVELARHGMTEAQRERVEVHNRNLNISFRAQNTEDGPYQGKEKGPDPCNWGEADLSGDELDLDVQYQILEACSWE